MEISGILFHISLLMCGVSCSSLNAILASDANRQCQHDLATYRDVLNGHADTSRLNDGHSGWISGYADLSEVLSFEGCFDSSMVNVERQLQNMEGTNIVNECAKYCAYPVYHYFAVKGNTCYCLNNKERGNLNFHVHNTSECFKSCGRILDSVCNSYVRAYRFSPTESVYGQGQCIYISKGNNGEMYFGSASCHTVYDNSLSIHGFICQKKSNTNCKNKIYNFPHYCVEEISHYTWTEALSNCSADGGSLISVSYLNDFRHLINCCNKYYWVGGFRAINPVHEALNSCLSITRVNSSYFLDSGVCKTSKEPICKLPSRQIPTSSNTTTDEKGEPYLNEGENNQVLITIGVTVFIIVVIVVLICVFFKCLKRRELVEKALINNENDFTNHGNSDHIINDDANSIPSTAENIVRRPERKEVPIKPERNTLRRQKKSIQSYENFQLVPMSDTEVKLAKADTNKDVDEYDHINLKESNKKSKQGTQYGDESKADIHIYNHMTQTDGDYDVPKDVTSSRFGTEDYSVTESTPKLKSQNPNQSHIDADQDSNQYDSVTTEQTNKTTLLLVNVHDNDNVYRESNSRSNNDKTNGNETQQLNTLKVVEDVAKEDKEEYYHYIDDDRLKFDDLLGDDQAHGHEYSDIDYGAVGPLIAHSPGITTDEHREENEDVYAEVNKTCKNVY